MISFLLDANLSPETADLLRKLGYDVKSILEENLGRLDDESIVELALKEHRVIITFDLDFGEIYHFRHEPELGIVILRLKNQTVESVNQTLTDFLNTVKIPPRTMNSSLVVITEKSYRISKSV